MATKKNTSQAQRAASGSSKKSASIKNTKQPSKAVINKKPEKEKVHIPARLISSTVIAALFVLFLVMFLNPDGALVKLIYDFVLGLFGHVLSSAFSSVIQPMVCTCVSSDRSISLYLLPLQLQRL